MRRRLRSKHDEAELVLQRRDQAADGGLAEAELFGGQRDGAGLADREHRAQLREVERRLSAAGT